MRFYLYFTLIFKYLYKKLKHSFKQLPPLNLRLHNFFSKGQHCKIQTQTYTKCTYMNKIYCTSTVKCNKHLLLSA